MTKRKKNKADFATLKNRKADHDDVQFQAYDLQKLKSAPQKQHILCLISVLNDLDSGTYLSNLLSAQQKSLPNLVREKWHDGVVLYLLRQRIATMYSALYDILREMKDSVENARTMKRGPKTPLLLWHTIIDNKGLDDQLSELVRFLDPGKSDSLKHVRDKLAAHADGSALSNGLNKLVESHDTGIVVRTTKPQRFRSFFIDDIVSRNWQEKAFSASKPQAGAAIQQIDMKEYSAHISEVRSKTADFVYVLFNTYCEEFSLLASDEKRKSIKKELQADLDARKVK